MDLQQVASALWAAAAPVLIIAVIAIAREWIAGLKDERLRKMLGELVRGIEQVYGPGGGTQKLKTVQRELASRGLPVDVARIEAAVHQMNTASEDW